MKAPTIKSLFLLHANRLSVIHGMEHEDSMTVPPDDPMEVKPFIPNRKQRRKQAALDREANNRRHILLTNQHRSSEGTK